MWLTMMVVYSISYSILLTVIVKYVLTDLSPADGGATTFIVFLLSLIIGSITASLFHEFNEKVG